MKKFWKLILDLFNSEDLDAKNESFALLTQFYDLFFDPNCIDLRLNEQFWIIIQVNNFINKIRMDCWTLFHLIRRDAFF
jgi:hypothetical protein